MDALGQTIFQKTQTGLTPSRVILGRITTRPGVYLYQDDRGTVIYVGKAKNLRLRVRQYFSSGSVHSPKTALLVSRIARISVLAMDGEFDALILESVLIRKYLPKYNAIARDDKSSLYLTITFDEELPRIFTVRKTTIDSWKPMPRRRFIAGPFQSGSALRQLLQSIRRIIPYCSQKKRDGSACFYTHIGLCRECPSITHGLPQGRERSAMTARYRRNLRRIALILLGHGSEVRSQLNTLMHTRAQELAFEEAGEYKRQIDVLHRLLTGSFDPSWYTQSVQEPGGLYETRLTDLMTVLRKAGIPLTHLNRIECMDISNTQGQWASGSLVVFTRGIPDTESYRRFRMHLTGRPNDAGMIGELVRRRFAHAEWPFPDILIVDGGKPQVGAAKKAMQAIQAGPDGPVKQEIPVIGLAKRFEEIVVPISPVIPGPLRRSDSEASLTRDPVFYRYSIITLPPASPALQLLQHIRDEAHRFAKRYHTMIRSIMV
ncbi:GIY-YIG nuclease family protein [Candidatus Gottesmanbacteria bacterium]|nr:GIY-YIG nuclease family protein [Candidatus Gottesmanbacteria bacterium]